MATYFNKTRGVVTLSLRNGESAIIPPKESITLTKEQDRSANILSRVRKGLIVPVKEKPVPPPTAKSASAAKPAPKPVPIAPIGSEENKEEVEEPSMRWTKDQLIGHAMAMGLDVDGKTKAEILEAIEEG